MPDQPLDALVSPEALLDAFDRAIGGEDADRMTALYAEDGQMLFANRDPIVGREAILGYWAPIFATVETTDASMDCPVLAVHGDRALRTVHVHGDSPAAIRRPAAAPRRPRGFLPPRRRRGVAHLGRDEFPGQAARGASRVMRGSEHASTKDEPQSAAGARSTPAALLAAFDRAVEAEDADGMAALFTEDAQLYFANREPISGRDAIRVAWAQIFNRVATSEWASDTAIVEAHEDRAYAFATYAETVTARSGGPAQRLYGRSAYFMLREPGGAWRITLALNSPARPPEDVA